MPTGRMRVLRVVAALGIAAWRACMSGMKTQKADEMGSALIEVVWRRARVTHLFIYYRPRGALHRAQDVSIRWPCPRTCFLQHTVSTEDLQSVANALHSSAT
eukprot:4654598-Pleurochrysis_carterae.AAC.4